MQRPPAGNGPIGNRRAFQEGLSVQLAGPSDGVANRACQQRYLLSVRKEPSPLNPAWLNLADKRISVLGDALQRGEELIGAQRFGQVRVHTCFKAALIVTFHCFCG